MRIHGKRIKWEPGALFLLVLLVGVWLAIGPDTFRELPTREDSMTYPIRIVDSRGVVEVSMDPATHQPRFRVIMRDGYVSPDMDAQQFGTAYGPAVLAQASAERTNWVFRKLNITSWGGFVWVAIGFGGQFAFSGRMVLQWLSSEKRRSSHVSPAFWLWSLVGSVMLFSYFVWRQDAVGILGQCSGVVIYARNLRLIYKSRRREARLAAAQAPAGAGAGA